MKTASSAYASIRQHTSAYVSALGSRAGGSHPHTPAYASIRQHTSALWVDALGVGIAKSFCIFTRDFREPVICGQITASRKKNAKAGAFLISRGRMRLRAFVSARRLTAGACCIPLARARELVFFCPPHEFEPLRVVGPASSKTRAPLSASKRVTSRVTGLT